MSWAAVSAALISATASAGIAAASAPNISTPNAAAASRRTVLSDLRTLPGRRMLEQAARLGTSVDYPTGRSISVYQRPDGTEVRIGPGETAPIGIGTLVRTEPETRHADFSGMGDADVQSELARQTASLELANQQQYGVPFAQLQRQQLELSDPLGFQAREKLHDELVARDQAAQAGGPHPVADELGGQVLDTLQRGRGLSPAAQDIVNQVMAERGGAGGGVTADIQKELEQGPQAEQRLQQAQQGALGFLSSGATPEDVNYRRREQSIADIGRFLGGASPVAQFGALSGAQRGTTPQFASPNLIGVDQGAGAAGQQGALSNYSGQVRNATTQVNDWFAGLSSLMHGAGAIAAGQH